MFKQIKNYCDSTGPLPAGVSKISREQIDFLISSGNTASDWSKIFLASRELGNFNDSTIRNCHFYGTMIFISRGGLSEPSVNSPLFACGIFNTVFEGVCIIHGICSIRNCSRISNAYIGENSTLISCGSILGSRSGSNFGDPQVIAVGPETGCRNVLISGALRYSDICSSLFRNEITNTPPSEFNQLLSLAEIVVILDNVELIHCPVIQDSYIGPHTKVFWLHCRLIKLYIYLA